MSSNSEAATATEEEAPFCYICYEEEAVATNPFMSDDVCDCRGTMKVHQICYELVRGLGNRCKTCRSVMKKPHALDARWGIIYDNKQKFIAMWRDGPVPHGPAIEMQPASGGTGMYYIKKRANYANGQLDGAQTLLNESGVELGVNSYRAGVLEGPQLTRWEYEDGESCSAYGTVKCGVKDGMFAEVIDRLRNRFLVRNYTSGVLEGPVTDVFYSNTSIKDDVVMSETNYKGGKKHGRQLLNAAIDYSRLPTIFKAAELNFHEGRIHGKNTVYYADNKVLCQGTFVKGVPVGRHYLLSLHNGGWSEDICYDKQGRLHGLCHYRDRYTGQMVSRLNYEHGRMAGRQIVYGAGNRETFSWTVDKADKEGKRLKGAVQWFNERCEVARERFVRAEEELCMEDVLDEPIMIRKPATLKLAFEKESNTPNYAAREFYGYIIYPSTAAAGATAEAVPLAAIAADDIECDCDYCLIGYGRRARAGNYYSDYEDDYLPCLYDSW